MTETVKLMTDLLAFEKAGKVKPGYGKHGGM